MGKVISLADKLEHWITVFTSEAGDISVSASNNGRLSFRIKGREVDSIKFSTVESAKFLSEISEGMKKAIDSQ